MKKYFFFSFTAHGLLFGALFALGTLLSRPRMSYYSVDLVSSLPSGPSVQQAPVAPTEPPVVKEPPAPVPVAPVKVSKEAIKTVDKTLKKPPRAPAPAKAAVKAPPKLPSWAVTNNVDTTNSGASPLGSNASAVSANAGPSFAFPWYLKIVSDRLDKQWHPTDEAGAGTECEISFVIGRDGQVLNVKVSRASGDPFFDQLAGHAVTDSNPMPPLPSGFQEPKLNVHMTFKSRKI